MDLGLAYSSSDEEDVAPVVKPAKPAKIDPPAPKPIPTPVATSPELPAKDLEPALLNERATEQGPLNGPSAGPSEPPASSTPKPTQDAPPGSPYTSTRALVQNLTLPTVPNFNIPASPPGSPPPQSTKKFTQFLDLKKKGQHFNQRLERSAALRDPGHSQRLMNYAGISEQDQYISTLPEDLAVPTTFPDWAYVEELTASQRKITKAKEEARARNPREAIDFVAATASGRSSKSSTPSGAGQSASERAVGGAAKQVPAKRKELEYRGGRFDASSRSRRSGSRSPKRRRSRSRERR